MFCMNSFRTMANITGNLFALGFDKRHLGLYHNQVLYNMLPPVVKNSKQRHQWFFSSLRTPKSDVLYLSQSDYWITKDYPLSLVENLIQFPWVICITKEISHQVVWWKRYPKLCRIYLQWLVFQMFLM